MLLIIFTTIDLVFCAMGIVLIFRCASTIFTPRRRLTNGENLRNARNCLFFFILGFSDWAIQRFFLNLQSWGCALERAMLLPVI